VCNGFDVSWAPALGATKYDIYRFVVAGAPVLIAGDVTSPAHIPGSCGVNNGPFFVRATNACGSFADSGLSAVVRPLCTPQAPSNVTATCDVNKIFVNWSDNSTDETGFNIYATPSIRPPQPRPTGANATSYEDDAPFDPPTAFRYCVSAVNSGNPSSPVNCQESLASCSPLPFYPACIVYDSWFQTQGGDVVAAAGTGELGATLPTPQPGVYPLPYFVVQGEPTSAPVPTGLPGMAFGMKNVGVWAGNLNESDVSTKNWLVDISPGWGSNGSGLLDKLENQYGSIESRILGRVTPYEVTETNLTETNLQAAINAAKAGHNWKQFTYEWGGLFEVVILRLVNSAGAQVNIGQAGTPVDLAATDKAVLLVDKGQVVIQSSILRTDTGNPATSGFLAIIAQDSVSLGSGVAVTPAPATAPYQEDVAAATFPPHISAVIYTQGSFSVNASSSQLKIDGGIVAMSGVTWGRTNQGPYPAEFVHYNPGMMRILRDVGLRRKVVMETVP
jgi:hypothetical protein